MSKKIDEAFRLTKSSPERCSAMLTALNTINHYKLDGDIVECGVWQGGNIVVARMVCPEKVCWLYDTFNGMTPPDPIIDIKVGGGEYRAIDRYNAKNVNGHRWAAASLRDVKDIFKRFGLFDKEYLRFIPGAVEETLLEPINIPDKIALLRLDTDWYQSTKIELEVLYPKVISGGMLIIDDYGHWAGCKKAVDDYFNGKNVMMGKIDYTAILLVKP